MNWHQIFDAIQTFILGMATGFMMGVCSFAYHLWKNKEF